MKLYEGCVAIINFSSEIVSPQVKTLVDGQELYTLPYAIIRSIPFRFSLADYYIFTSKHAVRQVLSRICVSKPTPVFVSGAATGQLVKKYWPEAQVIVGNEPGVAGIRDHVCAMSGFGLWYRGVHVVDEHTFRPALVDGVTVYQLIPFPRNELMIQLYWEKKISLLCFDSIQQADIVSHWGTQFMNLPVLVRSQRVASALDQRGWPDVQLKIE